MAYSKPPGGGGAAPWATPQEEEARVRRGEGRLHDDGVVCPRNVMQCGCLRVSACCLTQSLALY